MAKRMRDRGVQVVDHEPLTKVDKTTNTEETYNYRSEGSYNRFSNPKKMNHRRLLSTVINSKDSTIRWCKENNLLKTSMKCDQCNIDMKWVKDQGNISFFDSRTVI